ncbi:MAG TPA: TaqI-like C-terminal specificity domain-containing protein, partial [Ktedonobacteraceae bacterium]|nr:TaqI-like C-terminal specificity domain-containing protein [Ktedonobacteraceae bacterium]
ELRACDYYERFEQPKIIFPDIAKGCTFVFDDARFYSTNTTYFMPVEETQKYLVALLNSSLIEFFFRKISALIRGDYLRFFTQSVVQIPIRRIESTTPDDERTRLIGGAITLYTQNRQRDLLAFIDAQLAHEPERGDVVRDVLAYLAEQMGNLQAQRHTAIGDFQIGLQGVLTTAELEKLHRLWTPTITSPPERVLTTSTTPATLSSLPAEDSRDNRKKRAENEEMLDMLGSLATQQLDFYDDIGQLDERQWLWLLKRKFGTRSNMVQIAHIYRNYHPPIAMLDERLSQTDCLINMIVYKLYGLTEEEVGVVEGK